MRPVGAASRSEGNAPSCSDHWGAPRQPEPDQPRSRSRPARDPPTGRPSPHRRRRTAGYGAPTYLAAGDILGAPAAPPAARASSWPSASASSRSPAIGVGAAFAAGALGGGGRSRTRSCRPPRSPYVSVDLDPSLGQKVDALRFLRKFPSAKASLGSTDDIRQWFFDQATKDDPTLSELSYDQDVKPWIGDRFGVAVLPAGKAGESPNAVVVLQVSDEGEGQGRPEEADDEPGDGTCAVGRRATPCAPRPGHPDGRADRAASPALPRRRPDLHAPTSTRRASRGIALAWGDLGKLAALVPDAATPWAAPSVGLRWPRRLARSAPAASQPGRFVASAAVRRRQPPADRPGRPARKAPSTAAAGGTGVEQLPTKTMVALGGASTPEAIDQGLQPARAPS